MLDVFKYPFVVIVVLLWFLYLFFTISFLKYRSITKWVQASTAIYIISVGLSIIHLVLITVTIFRRMMEVRSKSIQKLFPLVISHSFGCVFVFISGVLSAPPYFNFIFNAKSLLVKFFKFFFFFSLFFS